MGLKTEEDTYEPGIKRCRLAWRRLANPVWPKEGFMHHPEDDRCSLNPNKTLGGRISAATALATPVLAVMLIMSAAPALAAATVRGQPANMQLQTENASIGEVLNALSSAFKLKYKLPPNVGRKVSGHYAGTLHQILARVLDGNDYIVKVSDAGIEVTVLGESSNTAVAPTGRTATPAHPVIAVSDNATAPQAAAPSAVPPLTSFR